MHELSVCQGMLSQVEAIALQHQAKRVAAIILQIGPLSGIEPALLQQAFTLARAGSIAEQATLVIESLPVRVLCRQCGQESEVTPNRLLCKHCGDYHTQLVSGDEMLLASVELDVDEASAQSSSPQQAVSSGGNYV
ncbi:MAG: hydrogenase maturation nickel metallochaperone HypA [Gammaproteobacteria bacterium]|nr:hydrogenase maturation nickel metallochaperone HypA [Gammaproteobacteria bacterium]